MPAFGRNVSHVFPLKLFKGVSKQAAFILYELTIKYIVTGHTFSRDFQNVLRETQKPLTQTEEHNCLAKSLHLHFLRRTKVTKTENKESKSTHTRINDETYVNVKMRKMILKILMIISMIFQGNSI